MRRFVIALCLIVLFAVVAVPIVEAQSGDDVPSPTFIPPVEADFYGGAQHNIAGPLGVNVSTVDRSLRVYRSDLFIPGCEVPLQASFTYSLKRKNEDSPFGRGWWLEHATEYTELPDGSLFIGPIRGATKQYWPDSDGLIQTEPGRYQLHLPNGTIYYFDDPEHKQVTKIESRNGNYLLMTYRLGRLIRLSDNYHRSLSLSYSYTGGAQRLVSITDANASPARTVEYSYDGSGLLTGVTDPQGRTTIYEYTPGNLTSPSALEKIRSPGGNWASISYAGSSNEIVSQVSSPKGGVEFRSEYWGACPKHYIVCPLGTVTAVTDIVDGVRRTMLYYYNPQKQLELIREAERFGTSFGYDSDGNRTVLTDPNLNQTKYLYDDNGNLLQVTDPLGRSTSYTYDQATGQVVSVTDPLGRTTSYQYDTEGHMVAYTDPLSNTITIEYDCCHPISVTNPLSQTIRYTYDAYGYPNTVQDGAGVTMTLEYSPKGDLLQETNGLGYNYSYEHDIMGRTTAVTDPDGEVQRFTYDSAGRMSVYISPEGRAVYYSYDILGRPVQATDALGDVEYAWDTSDNITAITDGEGNLDKLAYDFAGHITSRADGLDRATTFEYDDAGNLVRREDPLSLDTDYSYNVADELVEVLYPDGITVTFQYDAAGNLLQESNADVSLEYTYDAANRLTSVTMGGETIAYTYDAAGRRSSMTDPDSYITTYSYDDGGRLTTVAHQVAGTTNFHYDAAGRLSSIEYPNGVISTYTFDALGRLESIVHKDSSSVVLDSYSYTYDGDGNRLSVTDHNGTTSYSYDQRNQLIGASYPDSSTDSYAYDLAGNRISKNGSPSSYDAADQLTSAGSTSYGWDPRGNLISESAPPYQTNYQYDHENRLTQADYYDGTDVTYRYYPNGRLWSRTGRDGQTTHFYYDGPNLLLETDGLGNPINRYINGLGVDSWLGLVQDGQSYTYMRDGLNSVVGLLDGSQSLIASYQYDPWGEVRSETGSVDNPLRYTGRYWDGDAEFYRYRARLYNPESGRFLTRDPLGPIQVHRPYAYAENNPTSYIDPLGLDSWNCVGVKFGVGFLFGIELSKMTCCHAFSGECCDVRTYCAKLGALVGFGAQGCGGGQAGGPESGENLDTEGWSVFGEFGIGGIVGVGGDIAFDTTSGAPSANICLAGGLGAEVGVGGQWCDSLVVDCSGGPDNPPTPQSPPGGPGGDHADDNYSAADPFPPLPARTLAQHRPVEYSPLSKMAEDSGFSPPLLVQEPQVGVLWNGNAEEAWSYLSSLGWAAVPVLIDFDPLTLDLPVLFIPSGGLYGLEGAPSFRARLEAYAASGGVIIAFSQQRGDEFGALPGGELEGYGWTEDNSCFQASLYISEYHSILAGFSKSELTAGVDGFFTQLPEAAQTLLHRSKNGQPGLILYPYGGGWVVAASLYDDWSTSNWQPATDTKRLLDDTLSWALDPRAVIPEFNSGTAVTVPLTITNGTKLDAVLVKISIIEPNGSVHSLRTLTQTVSSYGQIGQTVEVLDLTPEAALGIWWVRYELYDDGGGLVQPAAWGARFALSDPHPAAGPDKTMGLSITALTEHFVPGPATFTFHVHNFTDVSRQATVNYSFPHHSIETGDPSGSYGGLSREVEVAANGVVTFTHTAEMVTTDRLNAKLVQENERQDTWFKIRILPANSQIQVNSDSDSYLPGQTVNAVITVSNRVAAAYTTTLRLKVRDAGGVLLANEERALALPSLGTIQKTITFTLLLEAQAGTATVLSEVVHDRNAVSSSRTRFQVLANPLTYDSVLPGILLPGATQTLVVTATNGSATTTVVSATLEVNLIDPTGAILPMGVQTYTVPMHQNLQLEYPFTTPAAQIGVYTFTLNAIDEYSHRVWQLFAPNQPLISIHFDQPKYVVREELTADVLVHNTGRWQQSQDLRIEAAEAGYVYTDTLALVAGGRVTSTHVISLPDTIAAGRYPLTATLAPATGSSLMESTTWVVPDSRLRVSLIDHSLMAGNPITLTVSNHGGVDTAGSYSAALSDAYGSEMSSSSGDLPVTLAGSSNWITMTVPAGIASGEYFLRGVVTNTQTSLARPFILLVTVDGADVDLRAATDHLAYGVGQPISVTTQISNTSLYPLEDAALQQTVEGPSSLYWYNYMPGTGMPGTNIHELVEDDAGIKWMATALTVNAFDDGGTPLDPTDDRWQGYRWPEWDVDTVFVDADGIIWIGYYSSGEGMLSALDDGGTPFDKGDDHWLYYTDPDEIPGRAHTIAQDPSGILWIGDYYDGLIAFDPGPDPFDKGDDQWYEFTSTDGLVQSWVNQVAVDSDGNIWIATADGVSVLDYKDDPFDPDEGGGDLWHTFDSGTGMPGGDDIEAIAFDGAGYRWFGSRSFVYVLDDGGTPLEPLDDYWHVFDYDNSGLCDNDVFSLALDSAGNKWFGGRDCVSVLDTGPSPTDGITDTWHVYSNDHLEESINVIYPDAGNIVWFGPSFTDEEGGLSLLDHGGTPFEESDDSWAAFLLSDGIGSYDVLDIEAGSGGLTWIVSDGAGLKALDQMGTPTDIHDDQWFTFYRVDGWYLGGASTVAEDHFGFVWAGDTAAIFAIDHGGTLSDTADDRAAYMWRDYTGEMDGFSDIAVDDANLKWISGRDLSPYTPALLVIDDGGTPITTTDDITMTYDLSVGLSGLPRSMVIDGAGVKWLVFQDGLLALDDGGTPFDANDDQLVTFTSSDGLLDGFIYGLAVDEQNRIWIPVPDGGVSVLDYNGTLADKSDDFWHSFLEAEDLPLVDCWSVAIDDEGDKWFAAIGVIRLDDGGDPFDGLNDTWEVYTTTQYLEDLEIDMIAVGGDRRIWVGIFNGGASMAFEQSGIYWSSEEVIDHLPPLGATQILTDIPGLSSAGRFQLKSILLSDQEQILARDHVPFYVTEGEAALTLDAAPDPARPGETLTVTVSLVNFGPGPLDDQTVTLTQDGAVIDTEGPFDVPAGSSYAYIVNTTAPTDGDAIVLAASSSGGLEMELIVSVARPVIEAIVVAPAAVGTEPFTVTVILTNTGEVEGLVGVSLGVAQSMSVVPAGGSSLVQHQTQICSDSVLEVLLTGDLTGTLNVPADFGPEVEAVFYPPPAAPLGAFEIPYVLTNTGSLDVSATVFLTVTGEHQESFEAYLPAGGSAAGSRIIESASGAHTLDFALTSGSCSFTAGLADFVVAPEVMAAITVTVGTVDAQVPVTATLHNTGLVPYSGTLQLETDDRYQVDSSASVAVDASGVFTFSLESTTILTGTRLVTVTAVTDEDVIVAQDVGSFALEGPILQITSLPTITVLPAGENVTLTFGVSNQGDQDGMAELRFSLGDLADEAMVQVVPAGDATMFQFVFYVPPELETKDYLANYDFNGEHDEIAFTIQGISITVESGSDQLAYKEGDPATLALTVTNQLPTTVPDLFALVTMGDITVTLPFTLTTSPEVLTFPITATSRGGGVIFYGIYHEPSERGIHLNTYRLAQLQPVVTVLLDDGVYLPGEIVGATVVTTTTGELEISAPGYTTTLVLGRTNTGFEFTLPAVMDRGTYAVNYRLTGCDCEHEGRQWQAWFDVAAPKIRVIESGLDKDGYFPGETVELRLTIASDAPVDVVLRSYLAYPDGSEGAASEQALSLSDRLNNIAVVSAVIAGTQSGLAFFHYEMVDMADDTLVRAAGAEAFDLGSFSLVGFGTNRSEYLTPTLPVTATVQIFASQAVTGDLSLTLDGTPPQVIEVGLQTGYQTLPVLLPGPIDPGHRVLTATFSVGGLASQMATTFDYGTSLPDLAPSLPSLVPVGGTSYVPTRTLSLIVSNMGQSAASGSYVSVYDESSGGIIIGAASVPSLDPNQQAVVEIEWDVSGQGGDHLLKVVVDPVAEFDTANNTVEGRVPLPRLASNLTIGSSFITAGEELTMQVSLENLQSSATLPVTVTLHVDAPISGGVFTETWTLMLDGGEQSFLDAGWDSPTSAETGFYFVEAEITDAFGEHHLHRTFFIVLAQPVMADFSATPTSGPEPLLVTFTNLSSGTFDTCIWEFGDGGNASDCDNPDHEYISPGAYSVTLMVSGPSGSDVMIRSEYIVVYQHVEVDFIGYPTSGSAPLEVEFTNLSSGEFDSCTWTFGDGGTSYACDDPVHLYVEPGEYTVTLTVDGLGGVDSMTLTGYIAVGENKVYLPLLISR